MYQFLSKTTRRAINGRNISYDIKDSNLNDFWRHLTKESLQKKIKKGMN